MANTACVDFAFRRMYGTLSCWLWPNRTYVSIIGACFLKLKMLLLGVRDVSSNVQFNFNYNGDDTRPRIDFDFGRLYVTMSFLLWTKSSYVGIDWCMLEFEGLINWLIGVRDVSCDVQFNCNGDNTRLDVR